MGFQLEGFKIAERERIVGGSMAHVRYCGDGS
jgi:hypothetical protein